MLQNRANLSQIRLFLKKTLSRIYSEGESHAILRLILEHVGIPYHSPFTHPKNKASDAIVAQINEIALEIPTGKPIQYILGYAWFSDLKIGVNPAVLIPRPETEELIYLIQQHTEREPARILDLATGSGCIALALKKFFGEAEVTGLDFCSDALETARDNARSLGLEVHWIPGNLLDGMGLPGEAPYDIIVSNPPYVLEEEKAMMKDNVLLFEPASALFVNSDDALIFYRAIAALATGMLSESGSLWLEINERKGKDTADLLRNLGFKQVEIFKDIHEKERFIRAAK